jgi:catechol 2,3-dioxygenase-like lactoylglutathione lyase family enzyme
MIDHIGVDVSDYQRGQQFYAAALAPLGYTLVMEHGTASGFGVEGKPDFWISAGDVTRPAIHVAFRCDTRAQVDQFHAAALKAGGKDNGGPGIRAEYAPNYYAAFVFDPDGHNIEAVCYAPD